MLDFYQKRKLRVVVNSRWFQAILLLVFFYVIWQAVERYMVAADMADRRAVLEKTAADLRARKESLEKEVQYLADDRGIEAEIRRQFDIALPGEEVVVILEEDPVQVLDPIATSTDGVDPWWRVW